MGEITGAIAVPLRWIPDRFKAVPHIMSSVSYILSAE